MSHAWGNTLDLKSEHQEQEQQENETVETKKAPPSGRGLIALFHPNLTSPQLKQSPLKKCTVA